MSINASVSAPESADLDCRHPFHSLSKAFHTIWHLEMHKRDKRVQHKRKLCKKAATMPWFRRPLNRRQCSIQHGSYPSANTIFQTFFKNKKVFNVYFFFSRVKKYFKEVIIIITNYIF